MQRPNPKNYIAKDFLNGSYEEDLEKYVDHLENQLKTIPSEPKSMEEIYNWVIVNTLRCHTRTQITIVANLLKHLTEEQKQKALFLASEIKK